MTPAQISAIQNLTTSFSSSSSEPVIFNLTVGCGDTMVLEGIHSDYTLPFGFVVHPSGYSEPY